MLPKVVQLARGKSVPSPSNFSLTDLSEHLSCFTHCIPATIMAASKRSPLSELNPNVPSKISHPLSDDEDVPPPAKKIKQTPTSSLLISSANPKAIQQFVDMIHGQLPEPQAKNKSLTPRIRQLTDQDLAFPQPTPFGQCMCLTWLSKYQGPCSTLLTTLNLPPNIPRSAYPEN